jgi:2-phospho-L-lactate/phosphoenolpyruvate guanylyltransferase
MEPATGDVRWVVVVPVKRLEIAKTRLEHFAGRRRAELALAFALDTIAAAMACAAVGDVVVVTDDERVAGPAAGLGCLVVPDLPGEGLNAALVYGAAAAAERFPAARPAALSADLPALRPAELTWALDAAAATTAAFVSDVARSGTTMLAAGDATTFRPRFGAGSRAAHLAEGAVELVDGPLESVRRDVDTESDIQQARLLGLGPRSDRLVTELLG